MTKVQIPDHLTLFSHMTMDFPGKCVKTGIFELVKTYPTFPETYGHASQSFIHQTKPNTSYFEHLKYVSDLSTYAREKGVSKL